MSLKRRDFISLSAMAAGTGIITGFNSCNATDTLNKKTGIDKLTSMTNDVQFISVDERKARVKKAQQLMTEQNIEALVLDAGTSLDYFTGIRWWPSERPMLAIIPAKSDVKYICPGFEEDRLRELIKIGKDVYPWQEDESPYKQVAIAFKDAGIDIELNWIHQEAGVIA